ncbi:MAG: hypothetical protein V3U09_04655 [Thermoplasmata archaeon]
MARYLPTKSVVYLLVLVLLIGVGFIGWFVIRYPATTGYTQYETDIPAGFDLADARQALVSAGYSVETYYEAPFSYDTRIWITDSSDTHGDTIVGLFVEEHNDIIDISATREIYILPYEIFRDLHEVSREQHEIAVEDVREILDVVEIPATGMFEFRDEVDSLDYFIPTSVFFGLVFGHLPLVILMAVLIVFHSKQENAPFSGQGPPIDQTQD